MLWNIQNTPHKIVGSIHALPKSVPPPSWITRAYESSQRIVFEADHREVNSFIEIGVDREGKHLQWPGSQDIYDQAANIMLGIGNDAPFDGLKPWRASIFMGFALLSAALEVDPSAGVETILRSLSDRDGLEIGYLEPPARAFELFESSSRPYGGLALFKQIVDDPSFPIREYRRILDAWLTSDINELALILAERLKSFPDIFEQVILRRNQEWLRPSLDFIESDTPTLFVVGALHLVGSGSFIDLLNGHGHKTTAVNISG